MEGKTKKEGRAGGVGRREGESELLKGLRRFTLRRYDWIMSASSMSSLARASVPLDAFQLL